MTEFVYASVLDAAIPHHRPMGLVDDRAAGLRAFVRYSKNYRHDIVDSNGRLRYMGRKQAAVWAILHRLSSSHETTTMHAIAKEASCAPSTVSRAVLRFQSWGQFAVDVKRGRGGGISVRLRTLGDQLAAYAERAWARLKRDAERVRNRLINVASTHDLEENMPNVTSELVVDATFTEAWDAAEERGRRLLAESRAADQAITDLGRDTNPDREWERAQEWAAEVIAERRRLDEQEPDWDLELDKIRSSYGMKTSIED